jgi:hypothetical protein
VGAALTRAPRYFRVYQNVRMLRSLLTEFDLIPCVVTHAVLTRLRAR